MCVEIEWDKSRQNYIGFKIKNWPTQLNVCVWKAAIIIFSFFLSFFLFCWGGPQQFEHTHNTYTLNLRLQSTTIFPELDQDLWFWVFFIRSSSVIRQIFWINSSVYRMTNIYNVWTKMYIAYRQKKVLWNVFL